MLINIYLFRYDLVQQPQKSDYRWGFCFLKYHGAHFHHLQY